MDLAQKANKAKRDLQAAAHKPESTTLNHAVDSFAAFADAVVEEIGKLKASVRDAEKASSEMHAEPSAPTDAAKTPTERAERETSTA